MTAFDVRTPAGEAAGTVDCREIFDIQVNVPFVRSRRRELAAAVQGAHDAQTRAEVAAVAASPTTKGTDRARQGLILRRRSPAVASSTDRARVTTPRPPKKIRPLSAVPCRTGSRSHPGHRRARHRSPVHRGRRRGDRALRLEGDILVAIDGDGDLLGAEPARRPEVRVFYVDHDTYDVLVGDPSSSPRRPSRSSWPALPRQVGQGSGCRGRRRMDRMIHDILIRPGHLGRSLASSTNDHVPRSPRMRTTRIRSPDSRKCPASFEVMMNAHNREGKRLRTRTASPPWSGPRRRAIVIAAGDRIDVSRARFLDRPDLT